eukprot:CAMPEP_0177616976 /NCGR_PEP_ID=MMETSP0419_2-20121207/24557_1 /TAXON_ID=582737 /ORGANISM="Tetraselmis sp., Strain GSL018" /LENGTH=303 /DNA_ID=CAMNT_0019115299 /DNA_START=148 /DNA_END=1058 /DNA_ORIENTATION=+
MLNNSRIATCQGWTAVAARCASRFAAIPEAPKDPILGVTEKFLLDQNPEKMNLGVGAYRDDDGKPVVLDCVRKAEALVAGKEYMEYLPIGGNKEFNNLSLKLAYGDNPVLTQNQVAAVQTLSGTGACRLFAEFQKKWLPESKAYISVPTWANHHNIWRDAGVEQASYRYFKPSSCGLDFEGMMQDIKDAPSGSVFLLHACAHNPTGVDPTPGQWEEISKLMHEKGHFPFFDMAYQGFATGDCERDGQAVQIFLKVLPQDLLPSSPGGVSTPDVLQTLCHQRLVSWCANAFFGLGWGPGDLPSY